jgi:hypothetical protein
VTSIDPPEPTQRNLAMTKGQSGEAPDLILDTNVYLELVDVQDLAREVLRSARDQALVETLAVTHRRRRAKHSLVLAWFCHVHDMTTAFAANEVLKLLLRGRVDANHPKDVPAVVTAIILRLVHEQVLSRWTRAEMSWIDWDNSGTFVDDELLDYAQHVGAPLITNEGNSPAGLTNTTANSQLNLRGKAKARGVQVFTPEEYLLQNSSDIAGQSRCLYEAVLAGIPQLAVLDLASEPIARRALEVLLELYRFILSAPP